MIAKWNENKALEKLGSGGQQRKRKEAEDKYEKWRVGVENRKEGRVGGITVLLTSYREI